MAKPRPMLAPNPRNNTTEDVRWADGYRGPRTITRTEYTGGTPNRTTDSSSSSSGLTIIRRRGPDGKVRDYWSDGQEVTDDDFAGFGAYNERLANEDARRWDLTYGLQEDNFELEREIRRAQIQNARSQLKENRRQFDATHGLDRDRFGLDILKTGASMRGPLSAFQGDSFAQGVANGGLSPYLRALQGGQAVNYGGGTATGASPTPLTVGTLATHLAGTNQAQPANPSGAAPASGGMALSNGSGGGGVRDQYTAPSSPTASANEAGARSTGTDQYGRPNLSPEAQAYLDPIRKVYEGGIANTGLGFLERMTPTQRALFQSGGAYLGRDVDADEVYYQRSRPGQRSAQLG